MPEEIGSSDAEGYLCCCCQWGDGKAGIIEMTWTTWPTTRNSVHSCFSRFWSFQHYDVRRFNKVSDGVIVGSKQSFHQGETDANARFISQERRARRFIPFIISLILLDQALVHYFKYSPCLSLLNEGFSLHRGSNKKREKRK